jgi:NitT/TauT family transport system substrate-binding protein
VAIFVRPDSDIQHPQGLRNRSIGVNFHSSSHYMTLRIMSGFLERDELQVVHTGNSLKRFDAFLAGETDAVGLMEPYITVAEKMGCRMLAEAHYIGMDMIGGEADGDTREAVRRALAGAVRLIESDKRRHVIPYLLDFLPERYRAMVTPEDFHLPRLRYVEPLAYSPDMLEHTVRWMRSWNLLPEGVDADRMLQERVAGV